VTQHKGNSTGGARGNGADGIRDKKKSHRNPHRLLHQPGESRGLDWGGGAFTNGSKATKGKKRIIRETENEGEAGGQRYQEGDQDNENAFSLHYGIQSHRNSEPRDRSELT